MTRLHHINLYIALMALLCLAAHPSVHAEEAKQILVFRQSGKVDIFNAETLKSIKLATREYYDEHPDAGTTQLFETADTIVAIPIAEIDSVTFGSRNRMEFADDVMIFTEEHLAAIDTVYGNCIRFRSKADKSLIPKDNQKVFCNLPTGLLPNGLAAKATSRSLEADGSIVVTFEEVSLNDIFTEFFFAGDISTEARRARMKYSVADYDGLEKNALPFNLMSELMKVKGEVVFEYHDVVINMRKHYYRANVLIKPSFGINFNVGTGEKELQYDNHTKEIRNGSFFIGGIINVTSDMCLFLKAKAEAQIEMELKRNWEFGLHFERANGKNSLQVLSQKETEEPDDVAKLNTVLKGELFFGLQDCVKFGIIGEAAGIGTRMRLGPSLKAELGMSQIREMAKPTAGLAGGEAKLTAEAKLNAEIISYYRHWLIGEQEENLMNEFNVIFARKEWNLLPLFMNSIATPGRCSVAPGLPRQEVATVATETADTLLMPLDCGFKMYNNDTQKEVAAVSAGTVGMPVEGVQPVNSFLVPNDMGAHLDPKKYTIYPTVEYAGHDVLGTPFSISAGANLSPAYFALSNSNAYMVGGSPVIGSMTEGNKYIVLGNHMPLLNTNPNQKQGFQFASPTFSPDYRDGLTGTWKGELNRQEISLTFNGDGTGLYNATPCTYEVNQPEDYWVKIDCEDGTQILCRVISITPHLLKLYFSEYKQQIKFQRENQ